MSLLLSSALAAIAAPTIAASAPMQNNREVACSLIIVRPRTSRSYESYDLYRTRALSSDEIERVRVQMTKEAGEIARKIGGDQISEPEVRCGPAEPVGHRITVHRTLAIDPYFTIDASKSPASKRLTLQYQGGFAGGPEGYHRASIDLTYRFLQCAGEVQVAYSLDRASLNHGQDYNLPGARGKPARTVQPAAVPIAPTVVPIDLAVWIVDGRQVTTFKDGNAGEALGMDCFSGQIRKIGTVFDLIGPRATPAQVNDYLARLALEVGAPLPLTLRNAKALATEAPPAPVNAEEAAGARDIAIDRANDASLQKPNEYALKEKARMEAQRAKEAREKADYERALAASAAVKAKYERDKAAADAAAARYRADRAAYEAAERAAGRAPK